MVSVESFDNFSCGGKKISFDNDSQLVVGHFQWPPIMHLIFKALISFAQLLEQLLHVCS